MEEAGGRRCVQSGEARHIRGQVIKGPDVDHVLFRPLRIGN